MKGNKCDYLHSKKNSRQQQSMIAKASNQTLKAFEAKLKKTLEQSDNNKDSSDDNEEPKKAKTVYQVYEPTLCYEDNQPCIRVAEGGNFSSGGANSSAVRAMDIRCSREQEMISDDQELRVKWLESCKMVADLNSKQLPRRQFEFLSFAE